MNDPISKIQTTDLEVAPFPHIFVEGLLEDGIVEEINRRWPSPELFNAGGIPGNYLFQFGSQMGNLIESDQSFWRSIIKMVIDPVVEACFQKYEHIFHKKFGDLLESYTYDIMLQEMGSEFVDHEVHNHHWHAPTWLFTNLIYIEGFGESPNGTALYRLEDAEESRIDHLAKVAAQTLQWEDMDEIVLDKSIPFAPNNFLSFLDSPISWHGVEPFSGELGDEVSSRHSRRVIRYHVHAPVDLIEDLYGVTQLNYEVHRRRASSKDFVVDWLKNEIQNIETSVHEGVGQGYNGDVQLRSPF